LTIEEYLIAKLGRQEYGRLLDRMYSLTKKRKEKK